MGTLTERNPLWINDEMWESACEPDCEEIDAVYRKLKEYEDLEEQGRIVKLPCKVGDTVYFIKNSETIVKCKADMIFIGIFWEEFGKKWFPTREEAEAKLKELRGQ
jgi:hypothetical protein